MAKKNLNTSVVCFYFLSFSFAQMNTGNSEALKLETVLKDKLHQDNQVTNSDNAIANQVEQGY